MSVQGEEPAVRTAAEHEIEQVLLGLADGSYILSTPAGSVAECGVGVVALLGSAPQRLVGRPTVDVLLSGADAQTRAAFERLARSGASDPPLPRTVHTTTSDGSTRSLGLVVIAVPLALGWEFTSLLGELGARDTATWEPEALRTRHGRALEAIESVCSSGAQPDPGGRLAGILIVVRDAGAKPLTREDVGRRMAEQRDAQRAAAAEAARLADEQIGRSRPDAPGFAARDGGDDELVERARALAERLTDAQRDAAAATSARDELLTQLAEAQSRLAAESAGREQAEAAHSDAQAAKAALEDARAEARTAGGELESTRRELESVRSQFASASRELESSDAELRVARSELEAQAAELSATRARLDAVSGVLSGQPGAARVASSTREASGGAPSPHPDPPPCAAGQAAALIGLDGTFKRLDGEFCRLLGYSETELRSARWPSVIDRDNLHAHREIARALRAGEIDGADIETIYMHAHGLLVPVDGRVSMFRQAGGEPYYLFVADVSRTSGPPSY